MKKSLILLALSLSLVLGGCSALFQELGVPDEYAQKADQIYEDVAGMVSKGAEEFSDEINAMADRLAELVIGSEQAYNAVIKLYANTRLAAHYDTLNAKTTEGSANRLCKFKNILGIPNSWYTAEKNPYPEGSDRWYAYGRFGEDNNIALGTFGEGTAWLSDTDSWVQTVYQTKKPDANMTTYGTVDGYAATGLFVIRDPGKIYPHAIAVCADGHLIYVEDVKFVEGAPTTVYFSETDGNGELDQWDGVLQAADYEAFLAERDVLGYIVPLNIFI